MTLEAAIGRAGLRAGVCALLACTFACGGVMAQTAYPIKSVRLLVGFAPGGAGDLSARLVATRMSATLGGTMVVENRGGTGGVIAAGIVAAAEPDGYTLLFGSGGALGVSAALGMRLNYDPLRDFAPVGQIITLCNVLAVRPSFPAKNVQELVALAKAKPGQVIYGTPGIGSAGYLSAELLKSLGHIDMVHVPYKGGSEIISSMVSDKLDLAFITISTARDLAGGRVRVLAVTTPTRDPALPDIPTFAEAGIADYDVTVWMGLLAPRGTPRAIVMKLNAAAMAALRTPEATKAFEAMGVRGAPSTPDELERIIRAEHAKWMSVFKGRPQS
jgi:tripartite-type tricarboxylate transporter receptor subunit TctC